MKKVLVIGALGYVGFEIATQLQNMGHEVEGLDNNMYGKLTYPETVPFPLHKESVHSLSDELLTKLCNAGFDTVINASAPDDDQFYSSVHTGDYLGEYTAGLEKINNFRSVHNMYQFTEIGGNSLAF